MYDSFSPLPDCDFEEEVMEEKESKKPSMKLVLESPFEFEGEEIKEIDLSGLFDLTIADLTSVDNEMRRYGVDVTATSGVSRIYAALVASKANKKPYEWLLNMKGRDSVRLMNMVHAFFYARV